MMMMRKGVTYCSCSNWLSNHHNQLNVVVLVDSNQKILVLIHRFSSVYFSSVRTRSWNMSNYAGVVSHDARPQFIKQIVLISWCLEEKFNCALLLNDFWHRWKNSDIFISHEGHSSTGISGWIFSKHLLIWILI